MECARIRDCLDPIVSGEIERGRSPKGYVLSGEKRKTTLADARNIVSIAIARLNKVANAFLDIDSQSNKCPVCEKELRLDEQYFKFASGNSPMFTLTTKFRAEWCANGSCDYYRIREIKEPSKIP